MAEKKEIRFSLTTFILILLIIGIISGLTTAIVLIGFTNPTNKEQIADVNEVVKEPVKKPVVEEVKEDEDKANIDSFDFNFLKLENKKENKVYSPLSIKYSLKMLEDATAGESKNQISKFLNERGLTKYKSNNNLAIANAFFVRDTFKDSIQTTFNALLKANYDADLVTDSFESAKVVNDWVENKTFKLLTNLLPDGPIEDDFMLVNTVAIDLDWINTFTTMDGKESNFVHLDFNWAAGANVIPFKEFNGGSEVYSAMDVIATINKYDILEELGEDNIKATVKDDYRQYLKDLDEYQDETQVDNYLTTFFETYIPELDTNYGKTFETTDFEFLVNDDVKVFAKDLKESDGTKLQYVGIMPIKDELSSYVEKVDDATVNNYLSQLKSIQRPEGFKEGVITNVIGRIPKFDFNYELDLKEDLKKIGITDVFEQGTADLSNLTDVQDSYISSAIHKAKIEFTQDGIKAAAATMYGGKGAGGDYDYFFDVPVEIIDITFDKPYMFLIRDVETGEIWFTGTVYEPKKWEDDPESKQSETRRYIYFNGKDYDEE